MAPETLKIEKSILLIVEGKEEELFIGALFDHLELSNIQVMPIGGKTNLRSNLEALKRSPRFSNVRCLGIVRDADLDPTGAFQSVCSALDNAGLPKPNQLLELTLSNPRVVVMILPDGQNPGMLEDVCLASVTDDPAIPCLEQYFECLEKTDIEQPNNYAKARVHAFLASRKKPDLRLGEAAQKKYWPFDNNAFNQIKDFLRQIDAL